MKNLYEKALIAIEASLAADSETPRWQVREIARATLAKGGKDGDTPTR